MNLKKTFTFIFLTFLCSWALWIIGLQYVKDGITQEAIIKFLPYFFAGVYGPSLSAMITTLAYDGFPGFLKLIRKIFIWKVPFINYLYLIILPITFVLAGIGLYHVFIGDTGSFDFMAYTTIPTVLWAGLYAGPMGEELGWRGFLMPELQNQFSNLKSAVIIGIIWFLWHIPLFLAPFGTLVSGDPISFLPVMTYFVMLICLSIILSWLVNNSKGSVLIAILFHLSVNAGIALLFFPQLAPDFKKVHLLSGAAMLIFTGIMISGNKLKKTTL